MGYGADVVHSLLSRDSLHISFPERGGTAPLSSLQTSVVGERLVVVGRMTGRPSCDIMNVVPLLLPPFSLNKILRIKRLTVTNDWPTTQSDLDTETPAVSRRIISHQMAPTAPSAITTSSLSMEIMREEN